MLVALFLKLTHSYIFFFNLTKILTTCINENMANINIQYVNKLKHSYNSKTWNNFSKELKVFPVNAKVH